MLSDGTRTQSFSSLAQDATEPYRLVGDSTLYNFVHTHPTRSYTLTLDDGVAAVVGVTLPNLSTASPTTSLALTKVPGSVTRRLGLPALATASPTTALSLRKIARPAGLVEQTLSLTDRGNIGGGRSWVNHGSPGSYTQIDPRLVDGDGEVWFGNLFAYAGNASDAAQRNHIRLEFSDSRTAGATGRTAAGAVDGLIEGWETALDALVFTRTGGTNPGTFTVRGPNAAGVVTSTDRPPYTWEPPAAENGTALRAWLGQTSSGALSVTFAGIAAAQVRPITLPTLETASPTASLALRRIEKPPPIPVGPFVRRVSLPTLQAGSPTAGLELHRVTGDAVIIDFGVGQDVGTDVGWLFEVETNTGATMRFWSGLGTLKLMGQDWIGTGRFVGITPAEAVAKDPDKRCSVTIDLSESTNLRAAAMQDIGAGAAAVYWIKNFNDGRGWQICTFRHRGRLSKPNVQEAAAIYEIETRAGTGYEPIPLMWSDEDQQRRIAKLIKEGVLPDGYTDRGLEYMADFEAERIRSYGPPRRNA